MIVSFFQTHSEAIGACIHALLVFWFGIGFMMLFEVVLNRIPGDRIERMRLATETSWTPVIAMVAIDVIRHWPEVLRAPADRR